MCRPITALLFGFFTLLAGCATGQNGERAVASGAAPRDAAAVERPPLVVGEHTVHRRRLANGLEALALRDAGEAHAGKASVHVVFGVGKRMEGPLTSGLAHLVEHAMFIGSKTIEADEHDARLKALGAESNAYTRDDYTAYYGAGFPVAALGDVLALEAERMAGVRWVSGPYEHERGRLEREEANTSTPGDARAALLASLVFRRHPYGVGVLDAAGHTQAPRLPMEVARDFHELWYRPERAAVLVLGDVEPAAALDAIEAAFEEISRGGPVPEIPKEPVDLPGGEARLPSDLLAERVLYVWVGPARHEDEGGLRDRLALEVLARIMTRDAARDRGEVELSMGGRLDRDLFVMSGTGAGAELRLASWYGRTAEKPVHPAELEREVETMIRSVRELPLAGRPYFSLAASIAIDHALGDPDHLVEREAALLELDPEILHDAAQRWLTPERRWKVRFVPSREGDVEIPEKLEELLDFARRAAASGDRALAIAAYERLLENAREPMWQVIHLYEMAALRMDQGDLDGAERDLERALTIVDYPAVRQLIEEVARRRVGVRGE